jgi:hypothetical protein
VAAAVIVTTVTAKVALIASAAVAVNVHGLVSNAAHEVPVQLARWNPAFGVAVICIWSLTLALQLFATQAAGVVTSVAVTVPPAPALAVIVTVVAAKVAATDALAVAVNAHGLVVAPPVQVTPVQLTRWKPVLGVAVICMLSLTLAVQVLAVQAAGFVRSLAVTVPPAPALAVIVTVVAAKVAVSLSLRAAGNEQGLAVEHVPPLQLANWKPPLGAAVIAMRSPGVATQGLAQGAPLSVIETVPAPAGVAPAVIVAQIRAVHGAAAAWASGRGARSTVGLGATAGTNAVRLVEGTRTLCRPAALRSAARFARAR